jgi:hypothetical protein
MSMGVRLRFWTMVTNGPIVHLPGDGYMSMENHNEMMMLAGENLWLIHQSSLAVLPAESFGSK